MIKVMLVDDEAIVRRGMIEGIKWDEFGVTFVGEAANGVEALEKIGKNAPDIVITDIRMPLMDGLELAEKIRDLKPNIKIVIVSGYEDFDFAKRALRIGVKDYILKPVSSEEIVATVIKLKEQIESEQKEKENATDSRATLRRNHFLIKSKFINNLVKDVGSASHNLTKEDSLSIPLQGPNYLVFSISIDDPGVHFRKYKEEDEELIKYAISNVAEETISRTHKGVVAAVDAANEMVGIINTNTEQIIQMGIILKEVQDNVELYLGISISIGVGSSCKDLKEVKRAYRQARQALKHKFYKGKKSIQFYDSKRRIKTGEEYELPTAKMETLVAQANAANWEDFDIGLKKLFIEFMEELVDEELVKEICCRLLNSIAKNLDVSEVPWEIYIGRKINPYIEIREYDRLTDILDWLSYLVNEMQHVSEDLKSRRYKSTISHAIKYMEKYYYTNITLDSISRVTHVSPNYFSKLFKIETGINFIDWLNNLRIEKSLSLLERSDLKIYEVAHQVGYTDYKYYSALFKKSIGVTPRQYRDGQRKR